VYTFKHALVQDAAYDPLLKSRRQELHTKIARVIEQRFPSIKTTEPDVAESLPLAREMLDLAEANGDSDLRIAGHARACACYCWPGEHTKVLQHFDKVVNLYDAEKHRHLADILNHDLKTLAGIHASVSTWVLGYPDWALRRNDEKDAHARWRDHPFDLGYALSVGAHEFDSRCELEELRKRAEECERLGRENSMPVLWAFLAPVSYAQALIQGGKPAEGIASLRAGLMLWDASGGKLRSPTLKAILAEGMALTGDLDDALQLISEQIASNRMPRVGRTPLLSRDPAPQGLDALTQGRP
jgi:hypothetical protein